MGLVHCDKCWDNICSCGYEYKNWSTLRLKEQIKMLQKLVDKKESSEENDTK